MTHLRHMLAFFAAAILALAVTGCNTMRGAGEDVEAGGEAVSETAEDTEEAIED